MDKFLKITRLKNPLQDFASADVICIWGPEGTGKTWLAEQSGGTFLTEDILRSKQGTLDFLERMRASRRPVILDDYESVKDLVGLRELTGSPSKSQMFITARAPIKLNFPVLNYEIPIPTKEKIIKILKVLKPEVDEKQVGPIAEVSNGSIRFVLQELEFRSDQRDFFQGPRKDLEVLFCKDVTGEKPEYIHEHGFMWAVVQENYPETLDLDKIAEIAHDMTDVDIIDERMYREQSWDLIPYLVNSAIFKPAYIINKKIKKLRPGSMWTKFQNECMKKKKLEILRKKYGLESEFIEFYAKIIKDLDPQDLNFMKKISKFSQK
jgi:hypothetical protein